MPQIDDIINFTASNGDFNGISLFEIKGDFAKKVSSDFSYTLTYLTLKYEGN